MDMNLNTNNIRMFCLVNNMYSHLAMISMMIHTLCHQYLKRQILLISKKLHILYFTYNNPQGKFISINNCCLLTSINRDNMLNLLFHNISIRLLYLYTLDLGINNLKLKHMIDLNAILDWKCYSINNLHIINNLKQELMYYCILMVLNNQIHIFLKYKNS